MKEKGIPISEAADFVSNKREIIDPAYRNMAQVILTIFCEFFLIFFERFCEFLCDTIARFISHKIHCKILQI